MSVKKVIGYRDVWMTFAILWTLFFHSGIWPAGEMMTNFKMIGFGGVDIFIFASGIGCFYSLEKDNDCLNFIKRRFVRIIPTYWIFLIGWVVYKVIYNGMTWNAVLGNFLCVRNFTGLGNDFNWYISAMWLMYFLAPFLKGVIDKSDRVYKFLLWLVILFLVTVCFWNATTYLITISRIPIFFVGMYMGKMAKKNIEISRWGMGIFLIATITGFEMLFYFQNNYPDYTWNRAYYWYPFILIVPGLCVWISMLMEMFKIVLKKLGECIIYILGIPGRFSFEVYLIHVWFFDILNNNLIANGILEYKRSVWVSAILALIPACLLLRCISKFVVNLFKKRFIV